MLKKIFSYKPNKLALVPYQAPQAVTNSSGPGQKASQAIKIIHAGGRSEKYYMAIPASKIIEKYPSFILAQPEVFGRPWDTIIRPEEILVPGQKYYVIPRQTLQKLRHLTRKTSNPTNPKPLVEDENSVSVSIISRSGILIKPGPRAKPRSRHVRFSSIDTTDKKSSSGSVYKRKGNK